MIFGNPYMLPLWLSWLLAVVITGTVNSGWAYLAYAPYIVQVLLALSRIRRDR